MIDSHENIESKAETTRDVIDSEKQPTPTNDMYVPPISHKVSPPSWTIASVTKMEAFVMFLVLLLILSIGMVYMYSAIDDANTKDSEQITNLLNHISMLEAKLDVYATDKTPTNITVNIDGVKYEGTVEDPTNPSDPTLDPNFDKSPFLGVGFYEGNVGGNNPIGLQVNVVYQYSPAELAGMKSGDIIISIDEKPIKTLDDLSAVIDTHKANDKIRIVFATTTEEGINVVTSDATLTYKGNFETPG